MRAKILLLSLISMLLIPGTGQSQAVSDYLILQDIGPYRLSQPKKFIPGVAPIGGPRVHKYSGVVGGSPFTDHTDTEYEVMYLGSDSHPSPTVKVIQHTGSESDKWLMHEMEERFRGGSDGLGLAAKNAFALNIKNNRVLCIGVSGWYYMWLSSNKVIVEIESYDADFSKPEPLDLVQAYLAKFPSIIPATFKLTSDHNIEWIKDEMDRRLWLCDKLVSQIQTGSTGIKEAINRVVDHLKVFLDYRQAYFGMNNTRDKSDLYSIQQSLDGTRIKEKVKSYKEWWEANKKKTINLSRP